MPTNTINSPTYNLTQGIDPNTVFQGQGEAGAPDPFQLGAYYDKSGTAPQNEFQSPGYQLYGQNWVNLVNAISQQDQAASEAYATAAGLATADRNEAGKGGPQAILQDFSNKYPLNKNSNLYKQINEGNFSDPSNNQALLEQIKPQVSQALGLDPNSPEANNYAQAFFTYALQKGGRDSLMDSTVDANKQGNFEHILADIIRPLAYAAAGGAVGWAAGGAEAAGTAAEVASDASSAASEASVVGSSLSSAQQLELFNAIKDGTQIFGGLASGNPLSALTSGLSAGSGVGGDVGDILKAAGAGVSLGDSASSGNILGTIGGAINVGQQAGSAFGDNPESGTSGNDISGTGGVDNISGNGATNNISGSPINNPAGGSLGTAAGNYYNAFTSGNVGNTAGNLYGNITGGNVGQAAGNVFDNISGSGATNNIPGTPTPSTLSNGLNAASGANNISGLLQGIIGNGQQPNTSNFGTNIISTPVTPSEAAGIPQAGNWTDKQYQDYQTEIMARVSSGQMTQQQAQQALQQAQQRLVGE